MRIAILNDVHGNIYALEKVIADLQTQSIDSVAFLGDSSFLGLYPQECFDQIQALNPIINIKGNTDANVEDLDQFHPTNDFEQILLEMCVYMDRKMNSKSKDILSKLKISEKENFGDTDIIFCHGSPYSYKDQLTEENKDKFKERISEENVKAIICAHTHQPAEFYINQTIIKNFGAIGYSFNGDIRAHYGIVEIVDDREMSFITRQIEYNIEKYKSEIKEQNPPFKEMLLYSLENGRPKPY
jgi:predicted phosphodiesterase